MRSHHEWGPIGIWTITKLAHQSSIPAIGGSAVDSGLSEIAGKIIDSGLKDSKNEKNRKYKALLFLVTAVPCVFFCCAIVIELIMLTIVYIVHDRFLFEVKYIYIAYKFAFFYIPAGIGMWYLECRRLGIKIFGK